MNYLKKNDYFFGEKKLSNNRQILDWTENKNYYKTTIIKWRGSSVG